MPASAGGDCIALSVPYGAAWLGVPVPEILCLTCKKKPVLFDDAEIILLVGAVNVNDY